MAELDRLREERFTGDADLPSDQLKRVEQPAYEVVGR